MGLFKQEGAGEGGRGRDKKGIWKYTTGFGPTLRHTYMFQGWKLNAEENSEQLTPR